MSQFMNLLFIILMMTILLSTMGQLLPSHKMDTNKITPYECGFEPIKPSRLPFSFRFFLVAILFLMFDLEMALLLPLPITLLITNNTSSSLMIIMFLLILTIGLLYEWIKGGLEWAKD